MDRALFESSAMAVLFLGVVGSALGLLGLTVWHKGGLWWPLAVLGFTAALTGCAVAAAVRGFPVRFWGPGLALALALLLVHAPKRLPDGLLPLLHLPRLPWGS